MSCAAAAGRTLRASADELKQQTDKMTQEHYSAGRKLTEHAQMFGDFMELQRKNRIKVCFIFTTY